MRKHHKTKYYYELDGTTSYTEVVEIKHTALNVKKILKSKNKDVLKTKANNQYKKWDKEYNKKKNIKSVENASLKARENLEQLKNILLYSMKNYSNLNWSFINKIDKFKKPNPVIEYHKKINQIQIYIDSIKEPIQKKIPKEPVLKLIEFVSEFTFFENLFQGLKNKKEQTLIKEFNKKNDELKNTFNIRHKSWKTKKLNIENANSQSEKDYKKNIQDLEQIKQKLNDTLQKQKLIWNTQKLDFDVKNKQLKLDSSNKKKKYYAGEKSGIIFFNLRLLEYIKFYKSFPKKHYIDYIEMNKILVIDYSLPLIDNLPTLKEVRFLITKNERKDIHLTNPQIKTLYDETIYKIILSVIYIIFQSDSINAIDAISFNGMVNSIDKSTGKKVNTCIASLQVTKSEISEINLKRVDSKLCFRNLKGIGSSTFSSLIAIQPILQLCNQDKRFIKSKNIDFDRSTNLALMHWDDFEHLIRELFEQEFASNGGEVRVTQASRDGGVDAIAFDPDPIRGGKIVIQAKRYTNLVGVSAVRDLYGTVLNEGATKGILVTTSEYGPDSYKFAKNKPITLLNGNNLLHLLSKHGKNAKIDIKEAKQQMKELNNKDTV